LTRKNSEKTIRKYLISFFDNKNIAFNDRSIRILPERWKKIIENNGQICSRLIKAFNDIICVFIIRKNQDFCNDRIYEVYKTYQKYQISRNLNFL